jgi:hypothetical protein
MRGGRARGGQRWIALAIVLAACGGPSRASIRAVAATEVARTARVMEAPIEIAFDGTSDPTISPLENQCRQEAVEACNGLDDDCDGQIDDGCGVQSGQLQIAFGWEGGADVDLYVLDPRGYTVSYQNRESPSGAILDHDGRGACGTPESSIESVYWARRPPDGRYRVEVHHWGTCGSPGQVRGNLSISVAGEIAAVYQIVLEPRRRAVIAEFELGEETPSEPVAMARAARSHVDIRGRDPSRSH